MESLFRPDGVAVIGAGQDPASMGGRAIAALQGRGYSGRIYPVNPRRSEIAGLPCYPSVTALPEDVDVVEILIAADKTADVVREAGLKGARWAVLLNAGFTEIGPEGARLQREVDAAAAEFGIRLVGPNCGGLINVLDDIRIGFMPAFDLGRIPRGPLGIAAQSGGVLTNALNKTFDRRIGVSYAASTGNESDATVLEFARYMLDDGDTRAVCLYTENLQDSELFIELCERALEVQKPVVLMKGGRSPAGQATAASHTGALATPQRVLEAVAERYGVVLAKDFDDWLDIGWFLASEHTDRPAPRRVATIATSGGTAVMTADALADCGIELPAPQPATLSRLKATLPAFGISRNPIDITAQYINDPELFPSILSTLEQASEFDAIVVSLAMVARSRTEQFAQDIVRFRATSNVPVITSWIGASLTYEGQAVLREHGVPMFQRLETAAAALAAWHHFNGAMQRARGLAARESSRPEAISLPEEQHLTEYEALTALSTAGIPFPKSVLAHTADEAVAAAEAMGLPVALKLSVRGVTHKSDLGGVILGIDDVAEVRRGFETLRAICAANDAPDEVLVQKMASGVVECILGLERDDRFGWMLLVGLGGVTAEVLNDTVLAPLPIDRDEANRLVRRLKGAALFEGFRGREAADVDALVDAIVHLCAAALGMPDDVVSVELNPVLVGARGQGVVAGDAVIVRNSNPKGDRS